MLSLLAERSSFFGPINGLASWKRVLNSNFLFSRIRKKKQWRTGYLGIYRIHRPLLLLKKNYYESQLLSSRWERKLLARNQFHYIPTNERCANNYFFFLRKTRKNYIYRPCFRNFYSSKTDKERWRNLYIYIIFLLDQKNKKKFIAVHIDFIVQLARKSRSTEVRHLVPPPLAGSASHVSAVHRLSYNPGIRPTPVGRQTSLLIAKYLSGEDQLPQLSIE